MDSSENQDHQTTEQEAAGSSNQGTSIDSEPSTSAPAQSDEDSAKKAESAAPENTPTGDAMLELVRRRREELKAELREIQQSTQPVTGQDNRSRVNRFFSRRLNLTQRSTSVTGGVANEDDAEEHRPEQVTVEVQGLLQRRNVSSVLASARFRRSLENSIRQGIRRIAAAETPSPSPLARPRHPPSRASPSTAPSTAPSSRSISASPPPPPPQPQAPVAPSAAFQRAPPPPPPPANAPVSSDARVPPIPLLSPISERTEATPIDEGPIFTAQGLATTELLRRANHEDFVMEISELVHRQLVSSALSEEHVRQRLENVARTHIANVGSESGRRAREAISNLPPSRIRRNDFSHLGITSGATEQDELDDAVSVISATASATIPYAQTSTAVNREISSLKSQINELLNLVKMSMNVQVDIQRSIRQEVAAAMNQHVVDQADRVYPGFRSRPAGDTKCIICLEHQADAVLYRCGHICTCFQCAMRLKESQSRGCPVCRAPIVDVVRAYRIEAD